jgi:hypothetical protein
MPKHGLESAGGLPKVQPQLRKVQFVGRPKKRHLLRKAAFVGSTIVALLQRLRIVERPRKGRHFLRSAILAAGVIAVWLQRLGIVERPRKRHLLRRVAVAGTIAASAFAAVAVWWRSGRPGDAVADDGGDAQASPHEPSKPDAEIEGESAVTDVDTPHDVATPVSA